jgi:hypothetical protein
METLLQDLRYGIRVLFRNRAISGIAIVVLAIGIGANTTIFSIINAVLLNPLPFHKPDQLVWLYGTQTQLAEAAGFICGLPGLESTNTKIQKHLRLLRHGLPQLSRKW